ncbi:hypothetical protein [Sinosporangium album]|uniref:hypothetical protein n=1 Tax=Sinosporangium album TaxID=504805 RepID=UPI00115FA9AD|nr:hypothetical protein [Sinosporangium album]
MNLVQAELERYNWDSIRVITGKATEVPGGVQRMLTGYTEDQVSGAYWELENRVVVQGQLFEAAQYVVPALIVGLLEDLARPARHATLELLFQIVSGESHLSEVERGLPDLGESCRQRAREGLWVIYRELAVGLYAPARSILECVELDSIRLADFLERYSRRNKRKKSV